MDQPNRKVSWPSGVPVVFGKRAAKRPSRSQDAEPGSASRKGGSLKTLIALFLNRPRQEVSEPRPIAGPAQPRLTRKRSLAELRAHLRN